MAFNQPLLPVLPVARELISKSKWMAHKGTHMLDLHDTGKGRKVKQQTEGESSGRTLQLTARRRVMSAPKRAETRDESSSNLLAGASSATVDLDPRFDSPERGYPERPMSRIRHRILNIFRHGPSKSRRSLDSGRGAASSASLHRPSDEAERRTSVDNGAKRDAS
ncbi:hypothetical protein PUNSTDRAFT_51070 [Punctularia strigosozonata HHB-11173 SS5]|uniref:uncharacterized protein n=1 Tax=Punctularia strigosozonata (strain HHB-11173) TaxID=741275 RepID=UPI0004417C1B|nr:uncharacterized protein PUNSTDRAFT_51070 [Punctularia strigosozonata HHB-11173 SS5]EIN10432.1 hypothetical protein PUNSTDRAFT_51070 [Punctularia strigosozonata HHB-11173 SS5]